MLKNYATPLICTALLGLALYGIWLGIKLAYDSLEVTMYEDYSVSVKGY